MVWASLKHTHWLRAPKLFWCAPLWKWQLPIALPLTICLQFAEFSETIFLKFLFNGWQHSFRATSVGPVSILMPELTKRQRAAAGVVSRVVSLSEFPHSLSKTGFEFYICVVNEALLAKQKAKHTWYLWVSYCPGLTFLLLTMINPWICSHLGKFWVYPTGKKIVCWRAEAENVIMIWVWLLSVVFLFLWFFGFKSLSLSWSR